MLIDNCKKINRFIFHISFIEKNSLKEYLLTYVNIIYFDINI